MLAGVCGGLASYLDVEVAWVRVGMVAATLFWGVGLIVYALLAITLPEQPEEEGAPHGPPLATADPRKVAGILLLTLGLLVIVWYFLSLLSFKFVLPVLLVGAGVFLLVHRRS